MARSFTVKLRSLGPGHPIAIATADCLLSRRFIAPAEALIRHRGDDVVAIVDEAAASASAQPTLGDLPAWSGTRHPNIPIVRIIEDVASHTADRAADGAPPLIVGLEFGRRVTLRERHRDSILAAARSGVTVFHGLREDLTDASLAPAEADRIISLRTAGQLLETMPTGRPGDDVRACRVLAVSSGTDGVLSTNVSAALDDGLRVLGATADWLPTTWIGMALRGAGREMSVLQAGAAAEAYDRAIRELEASAEIIVVDGQGGLCAPLLPASTSAAVSGTRAAFHVLCHTPADAPIATELREAADRAAALHLASGARSTLGGIAIDVSSLEQAEASRAIAAGWSLGVPCVAAEGDVAPIASHLLSLARLRSTSTT